MKDSLLSDLEAIRKELLKVLAGSPELKAHFVQEVFGSAPNLPGKIEALRKNVRQLITFSKESRAKFLRMVGNEHLGVIEKPEDLMQYIHDQDAKVRQAALIIGSERWPRDSNIAEACKRLALSDSDVGVRGVAASSLGNCYANTFENETSRLLAHILIDERHPKNLRLSAYVGLLEIHGKSLRDYYPSLTDIRDFKFPEGVDWDFVGALV